MSLFQIGQQLSGRYEVTAELAGGSFGVVYVAHDLISGDRVALKTLQPSALANDELLQRFTREAEIGAQLQHPNVARLRDLDALTSADGQRSIPFLVFDCVPGVALGSVLRTRGSLRLDESVHVMDAVLGALDAAHRIGVLHRDLKPDNVLAIPPESLRGDPRESGTVSGTLGLPELDDAVWQDLTACTPMVVDFGLGKLLEIGDRQVQPLTRAGVAAGTAHYISPEQVRALTVDYRADLYGAAMLWLALLLGRAPYEGRTAMDVAMQHVSAPLPDLPASIASHALAEVLSKAAEKNPADRYNSAGEMRWAMQSALDPTRSLAKPVITPPPAIRPTGPLKRLKRWLRG
ncbi:MAG: serine/threonine protein kinase [Bradymonadia bacterium]|jgi:serine/threonine protein kinase